MSKSIYKDQLKELQNKYNDLNSKYNILVEENNSLLQKLYKLQDAKDNEFVESPHFKQLKRKLEISEQQVKILENRLAQLESIRNQQVDLIEELQAQLGDGHIKIYNERGAGRHRRASIERFNVLYQSGISMRDIMIELNISRSTYFRYKREIED